jgi:hypothetical protein
VSHRRTRAGYAHRAGDAHRAGKTSQKGTMLGMPTLGAPVG